MKMIDVLNMIANGEIKEGTKIILNDDLFIFNGRVFERYEREIYVSGGGR